MELNSGFWVRKSVRRCRCRAAKNVQNSTTHRLRGSKIQRMQPCDVETAAAAHGQAPSQNIRDEGPFVFEGCRDLTCIQEKCACQHDNKAGVPNHGAVICLIFDGDNTAQNIIVFVLRILPATVAGMVVPVLVRIYPVHCPCLVR
jgi:hypothetical protein